MKYGIQLALIIGCLFFQQNLIAQESKPSLEEQMDEIMDKGRTYNQYKVIPITRMQELFDDINAEMKDQRAQINGATEAAEAAQIAAANSEQQRAQATTALAESQLLNDSIGFMGISFQKSSYNFLVWGIICLLIAGMGVLYVMFQRSHKITKGVQSDLNGLTDEFEAYKTKSHEKQVKLKRELQTAMNTLHEKGIKV